MIGRSYRAVAAALLAVAAIGVVPRPAAGQGSGTATASYPGRYPFTDADVHFITGMISHHAQAIVMARWAPTHGASASVRILCERIINAQTDEIALMQRWLKDRNQPVPEAKPGPIRMKMNGMEHEMLMPGMLSDDQLKQLDAATGAAFDRLFLTFMIQHHRGAVAMVDQLFATTGAGQDDAVFKMANDIQADQSTEINRMLQMLFTIPGE